MAGALSTVKPGPGRYSAAAPNTTPARRAGANPQAGAAPGTSIDASTRSLPLAENRVLRADVRLATAEPQRQPSMSMSNGPRSPTSVDMLPLSVARDASSRSNGGSFMSRELRTARSESPTNRHGLSATFSSFAPGSSGSFVQPALLGGSGQPMPVFASASSVHVPARNASSFQPVSLPGTERLVSGSFSNVQPNVPQVEGERKTSSAKFNNLTPQPGALNLGDPSEPLPTRYSTGSYVAAAMAGSMRSQTREANEAVGNAVVISLQSRLEDVQNNIGQEPSFLTASHAASVPNGSPDAGSELTWADVPPGGQAPEGEEEVFVMDEFSFDVYEAAARLTERIKAAAGMALLRDGLGMANFGEEVVLSPGPGETQDDGKAIQWRYNGSSQPPVVNVSLLSASPEDQDVVPVQAADGTGAGQEPQSPSSAKADTTERGALSGEEVTPDTMALVPPRVGAGAADDSGLGPSKDVLLVGDHEMEETWVLIDGLRVRVEMLPGGLLPERDTIFEELNFFLRGLQNWEPGEDAMQAMPSFLQLSEMVRFSEKVVELENHYLAWAEDKDAAPVDLGSKQHVCEWLGPEGEKDTALESLRMAGARRCKGPEAEVGSSCRKLLRHELYKRNAQRCPVCKRPSKRAMATSANQKLAGSEVAALLEGSPEPPPRSVVEGQKHVEIKADTISVMEVEAREQAFALYRGEMNTYYRALALPSDVEYGKEANLPVLVTWVDGDQNHRQVPPLEVIFLDDAWARDATDSNAAHWENSVGRLMPGGDRNAELLNSATPTA